MSVARVFVDFYDHANLGDDLLLVALVRYFPNHQFEFMPDRSDPETFAGLNNVRRLWRPRLIDALLRRLGLRLQLTEVLRRRAIRRADLTVRLGGSLYMEIDQWRVNARRDDDLTRNRRGCVFLNGNFGPWQSEEFLHTYEAIFSRALDVTVRDQASLAQLAAVPGIRLAPDLLFATQPLAERRRDGVVISLIDLTGRPSLSELQPAYDAAMAALVEDLKADGQSVTLMSFCASEGDEAVIGRVLARIDPVIRGEIELVCYRGDFDAALAVLHRAEIVIATRFHAMILGLRFGARVRCVEYSNKVTNALADLGLTELGSSIAAFVELTAQERRDWVASAANGLDPNVVGQAEGHFAVLEQILGPGSRAS